MTPATVPPPSPATRPGTTGHELDDRAPGRRAGASWVAFTGVVSGVVAAVAMAVWLMFCAEVASDVTPVEGIESSTWTPITAVTSFLFGIDAFHGDFHVLSILFGLGAHLFFGVLFGVLGVALIAYTFAGRPGLVGAALFGFSYALVVQVLFRNVLVNWVQDVHTVSDSLPTWGWWVAHAFYGATLGIVAARLLSAGAPGVTPAGLPAEERLAQEEGR